MGVGNPLEDMSSMLKDLQSALKDGAHTKNWSNFVSVIPGSDLKSIVTTGMYMQAAVTGKTLYVTSFKIKDTILKDLIEDISTIANLVIKTSGEDINTTCHFLNDKIYVEIFFDKKNNDEINIFNVKVYTFDDFNITTIKNFIEYLESK